MLKADFSIMAISLMSIRLLKAYEQRGFLLPKPSRWALGRADEADYSLECPIFCRKLSAFEGKLSLLSLANLFLFRYPLY
jgi:hypothetical protein